MTSRFSIAAAVMLSMGIPSALTAQADWLEAFESLLPADAMWIAPERGQVVAYDSGVMCDYRALPDSLAFVSDGSPPATRLLLYAPYRTARARGVVYLDLLAPARPDTLRVEVVESRCSRADNHLLAALVRSGERPFYYQVEGEALHFLAVGESGALSRPGVDQATGRIVFDEESRLQSAADGQAAELAQRQVDAERDAARVAEELARAAYLDRIRPILDAGVSDICIRGRFALGLVELIPRNASYEEEALGWLQSMRNSRLTDAQIRDTFCGEVNIGASEAMVQLAWGKPDRVTRTQTALGIGEVWVYYDGRGVLLINDVVETITTSTGR